MAALLGAVYTGKDRMAAPLTWLTALVMAALAVMIAGGDGAREGFGGMVVDDAYARFAKVAILLAAGAVMVVGMDAMAKRGLLKFEYPILIALSVVGMMVMVSAGDLIALYMGLELQSLALYVVASLNRDSVKSTEAGHEILRAGRAQLGPDALWGLAGLRLCRHHAVRWHYRGRQ